MSGKESERKERKEKKWERKRTGSSETEKTASQPVSQTTSQPTSQTTPQSIFSSNSTFDINQLELALINRMLDHSENENRLKNEADFQETKTTLSKNIKVLMIQKYNLMEALQKSGKEMKDYRLEEELDKIIHGQKPLSFAAMQPTIDKKKK